MFNKKYIYEDVHLCVGNKHEVVPAELQLQEGDGHRWTAFVRFVDSAMQHHIANFIQKVEFRFLLNGRFEQQEIKPSAGTAIEMSTLSSECFEMPISIYWADELDMQPTMLKHKISFKGAGSQRILKIAMKTKMIALLKRAAPKAPMMD